MISMFDPNSPSCEKIATELEKYSKTLAEKPRLIVGSKSDSAIEGNSAKVRAYAGAAGFEYYEISAVVGDGVRELVRRLAVFARERRSVLPEAEEEAPALSHGVLPEGDPSPRSG